MNHDHTQIHRRQLFGTAAGAVCAALPGQTAFEQEKLPEKQPAALAPLNRFPRMVQEWYVEQVRAAEKTGTDTLAKLKTKADAEAYIGTVREKIATCFGQFPEKTPLDAKVTGKLDRDAYTIEKVIFESRPGFLVTANLYLPKGANGARPGVVGSCGHSTGGATRATAKILSSGVTVHCYCHSRCP